MKPKQANMLSQGQVSNAAAKATEQTRQVACLSMMVSEAAFQGSLDHMTGEFTFEGACQGSGTIAQASAGHHQACL